MLKMIRDYRFLLLIDWFNPPQFLTLDHDTIIFGDVDKSTDYMIFVETGLCEF